MVLTAKNYLFLEMQNLITQKIEAQRQFFSTQKTKDLAFRIKALKLLQKEIIRQEDAICEALYADFKKPKFESLVTETQFVLAELKSACKYLNLWAKPERVPGTLLNFPSSNWIYKEPYGTVLVMAPWNYPFQLAILPLISAIAAGNTVVLKPSELTPHTSALLKKLVASVFDESHAMVIEGDLPVSQQLLAEKWDYIFFTGSTKVGKIVYQSAAKNLTPVTLELGGKSPCIVDETALLSQAAKRIVWGKYLNAGQTCIAPDYILVHRSVKDLLIEEISKVITKFYGTDVQESADLARIVSSDHYNRLLDLLTDEDIVFGGQRNDKDNFLGPTLLNEPTRDSKVMQEEIFGPILPIISYDKEEDIAPWILSQGKPLAAYIFSRRTSFQDRLLKRYSFGGGVINDTLIHISNKELPFGGVGQSGIGTINGKRSFMAFSHQKSIVKRGTWLDIPLRNPPYTLPLSILKKIKHLF